MALRGSASSTRARRSSCRSRRPGKALKLTIAPVQEQIPIYLAAIGPKNTALAGGDRRRLAADPVLARARRPRSGRCSRRASRAPAAGRLRRLRHRARGERIVGDDREAARDVMRPFLALYVGGMGRASRTSTTGSSPLRLRGRRADVQDLYLAGRKDEAAAALRAS